MIKPAYKLKIGDQLVDTTDEPRASTLVDLQVNLDMDVAADSFTLKLGNVGSFTPEREDTGTVELGYADAEAPLIQVLQGEVDRVSQGSTIDTICGYSGAAKLLGSFADITYESKSAGGIVKDLADKAGIPVARAEEGIQLPAYVIDGRASVYHHLRDLARLSGFDLYFNSDNQLVFQRFAGGNQVHVFNHASHILHLEVNFEIAAHRKVSAFGESGVPAGADSWAWLTKDFSAQAGQAGTGDAHRLLENPALRTGTAARTAANAAHTDTQRRQVRGSLLSMGRPQVKLGDAIRLSGLADESLNKIYQVRGVRHRISKRRGFTTRVDFRAL